MVRSDYSACVIIPARFSSSRFPGKPLINLCGKPMVIWVAEASARAVGKSHVFVATDSPKISEVVISYGFNVILTSGLALTGTDRVAEAAIKLDYDIIINVQGDEPLVNSSDISKAITIKAKNFHCVLNGYTSLLEDDDPYSLNIPKVILSNSERLIYISRLPIPAVKEHSINMPHFYKQVCIYAFTKKELNLFSSCTQKGNLEVFEDIEIIRFLELDIPIQMFYCQPNSLAVDVPEDVSPVEYALKARLLSDGFI